MAKKKTALAKRGGEKSPKYQIGDKWQGKHKSLWIPERDGASSSLLDAFLTCKEQMRLAYVEGLVSHRTPYYFAFGTCIHWVLKNLYGKHTPPKDAVKWGKRQVVEFQRLWTEEAKRPTAQALAQQEKVYAVARAVLPNYVRRWRGDFPGEKYPVRTKVARPHEWLGLEQRFSVPYTYHDGVVVPIVGTRDGVFKTKRGHIWVFDTKCRSVIIDADILETMPTDLQIMLYLWATREELGKMPHGFLLNTVRRPGIHWRVDDTPATYAKRVATDVSDPGRWDHYFIRYEMGDIDDADLDCWREEVLDPLMYDLRGWWTGEHPHYPNHRNLITKYGRSTFFNAITHGNMDDLYTRKRPMAYQESLV